MAAEVLASFSWWLLAVLAGWLAWPLCAKLLGALPDRGYTASKAFSLLMIGFLVFTFGSFGFLRVAAGSMLVAAGAVAAAGVVNSGSHQQQLQGWARTNWRVVLVSESIFF